MIRQIVPTGYGSKHRPDSFRLGKVCAVTHRKFCPRKLLKARKRRYITSSATFPFGGAKALSGSAKSSCVKSSFAERAFSLTCSGLLAFGITGIDRSEEATSRSRGFEPRLKE